MPLIASCSVWRAVTSVDACRCLLDRLLHRRAAQLSAVQR